MSGNIRLPYPFLTFETSSVSSLVKKHDEVQIESDATNAA